MKTTKVAVLVGALCLVALGPVGAGLALLGAWLSPSAERLPAVTLGTSFLALGAGLGSALAWQAWQAIEDKASGPFRPGRIWLLVLAFAVAVAAGQAVLMVDFLPLLAFPPLHLVAAAIPPIIILALAGRQLGAGSRWRDIVLQFSSGAFLSASLAFLLEIGILLAAVFAGLSVAAMVPGGRDRALILAGRLQDSSWMQDSARQSAFLGELVSSPVAVALVLLTVSGLIPLIEEAVKTIGVGLMTWRRPTRSQAALWGLAGGAGFALTEGLLSSAAGLEAWAPAVLARSAATLFHCFSGALMGLAWYAARSQQSWRRPLGLYGASVTLHGIWNGLATGAALMGLNSGTSQAPTLAIAAMGLLALAFTAGLVVLVHSAGERSPAGNSP